MTKDLRIPSRKSSDPDFLTWSGGSDPGKQSKDIKRYSICVPDRMSRAKDAQTIWQSSDLLARAPLLGLGALSGQLDKQEKLTGISGWLFRSGKKRGPVGVTKRSKGSKLILVTEGRARKFLSEVNPPVPIRLKCTWQKPPQQRGECSSEGYTLARRKRWRQDRKPDL